MILANPDPWFSHRTCHQLALAAAVQEAAVLLARPRRTAVDDVELLRIAHCACECAGLVDGNGPANQRVRTGLLLARALLAVGRHHQAAEEARRLQRLARGLPWAAEAAVHAALVGIAAWEALACPDHADHLRTLSRSLVETLTDERQRARLTHLLDHGVTGFPASPLRYGPLPLHHQPTDQSAPGKPA